MFSSRSATRRVRWLCVVAQVAGGDLPLCLLEGAFVGPVPRVQFCSAPEQFIELHPAGPFFHPFVVDRAKHTGVGLELSICDALLFVLRRTPLGGDEGLHRGEQGGYQREDSSCNGRPVSDDRSGRGSGGDCRWNAEREVEAVVVGRLHEVRLAREEAVGLDRRYLRDEWILTHAPS